MCAYCGCAPTVRCLALARAHHMQDHCTAVYATVLYTSSNMFWPLTHTIDDSKAISVTPLLMADKSRNEGKYLFGASTPFYALKESYYRLESTPGDSLLYSLRRLQHTWTFFRWSQLFLANLASFSETTDFS